MPNDDERREVARRLRDDAKGGALPYSDFLGAVAYDVGAEKEHAAVLNRIADLIEPEQGRTCRNVSDDKRGFTCSECGTHVRYGSSCHSYVDDAGARWYTTADKTGWNYCPNCGAKVVEEIGSGL